MGARRIVRVGACLLMLLVLAGCDWLQSGYGSGHANFNPGTEFTPANVSGLTQKFTIATAGRSYGQPIIVGDTLYAISFEAATSTARLEAFDTMSGSEVFATTLATGVATVPSAPPVEANGMVYADVIGVLDAVSASSGAIIWSVSLPALPTGTFLASNLTIDNGIVMVPLFSYNQFGAEPGTNQVVGVDATTGALKWTWTAVPLGSPESAPVASPQGLVAINYKQKFGSMLIPTTVVIDERDGALRWETDPATTTSDDLETSANGLFYGSVLDQQTTATETGAVDPATGSFVWTHALLSGTPAVSGSSAIWAYFLNDTAMLSAFEAHTGAGQWTSSPANGATRWSDPVIAGGVVFWVTTDGTTATLRAYDANTGSQAAAITLPTSSTARPIVANGHVYIADGTSITAFGLA